MAIARKLERTQRNFNGENMCLSLKKIKELLQYRDVAKPSDKFCCGIVGCTTKFIPPLRNAQVY